MPSNFVAGMLPAGLIVLGSGLASGQDFPLKPIRIVTSAAGGGSDSTSRLIAQAISGPLGQPVIIDNRGSTLVSIEVAAKAPPDGYTLLVSGESLWLLPLMQKVSFDPLRDFAPISMIERSVSVIAVHPSLPVKSIRELLALARARPGELNSSSSTVGGSSYLATELFKAMAGVNIVNVTYKGIAPGIMAVIGGEVQMTITSAGLVTPHVKPGKLRALAVTSAEPSVLAPGLPTVAASGVPGYEATGITGMFALAKTPAAIVNRLSQEVVWALNQPDLKGRFFNAGVETIGSTPEEYTARMKSEVARMGKVIRDAGIKTD